MTSKQDHNHDSRWNSETKKRLWVCFACGLVAASLWWLPGVHILLEHLEVKTRDILMGTDGRLEPREDLVFLGIDARSLQAGGVGDEELEESKTLQRMRGQYPWDRRVYAAAIDKLANAGARVIVLDIVFAQNIKPESGQQGGGAQTGGGAFRKNAPGHRRLHPLAGRDGSFYPALER